jgi:hypothetical protein
MKKEKKRIKEKRGGMVLYWVQLTFEKPRLSLGPIFAHLDLLG